MKVLELLSTECGRGSNMPFRSGCTNMNARPTSQCCQHIAHKCRGFVISRSVTLLLEEVAMAGAASSHRLPQTGSLLPFVIAEHAAWLIRWPESASSEKVQQNV